MNNFNEEWDEITSIQYIGEEDTIDINVSGNRLFYANNILTHNSAVEEVEFDHSHISGGISKINTADNVFGIFTSRAMRERGRYQIQLMKTRSSSGVGMKVDLGFDINSLRILDLGEDAEQPDSGAHRPNIYTSIKTQSTVSSGQEVEKIDADVQSNKLKRLLGQIKP